MPTPPVEEMVPALLIAPVKVVTSLTSIPLEPATMLPALLMPPLNVVAPVMATALAPLSVALLPTLIPPENTPALSMAMAGPATRPRATKRQDRAANADPACEG